MSTIDKFSHIHDIQHAVSHIHDNPDKPIVTQTNSVEDFVKGVFGDIEHTNLFVNTKVRMGSGIGPHFDVYENDINPEYPFVATYNTVGYATLRATALDSHLVDYYKTKYPEPTQEAWAERRALCGLAFAYPVNSVYEAAITPGTGLIIPQNDSHYVAHNVLGELNGPYDIGRFLKFSVPDNKAEAKANIRSELYTTYAQYLEQQHEATEQKKREDAVQRRQERVDKLFDKAWRYSGLEFMANRKESKVEQMRQIARAESRHRPLD